MSISFNEMKEKAIQFAREWKLESNEKAEAQSFWNDFFQVFGISRRRVAAFEKFVATENGNGFIDLFWKGKLIVEHKSKGKNLDTAYSQALKYFSGLKENDLPKYIIVSDFENFKLYDLDESKEYEFKLNELYTKLHLFNFISDYDSINIKEEDPVNIDAGTEIGKLHDALMNNGYTGHNLGVLLVRLLFCFFADDTEIWTKGAFEYYIVNNTKEDGSDLGAQLNSIFDILNTDNEFRQKNINPNLDKLVYINGGLFRDRLPTAFFDSSTRKILIDCCRLNWSSISPVVFGSIFQNSMDKEKRQSLGAHYTAEKDIFKVLNPLFLDDLYERLEKSGSDQNLLKRLLIDISQIKILDPACGCGDFLVLAYRELRRLQLEIIKKINSIKGFVQLQDINVIGLLNILDVDSMYGFEIDELSSLIAKVALWMSDHQMNMELSKELGRYYARIPLKKAANIFNTNALQIDWKDCVKPDYISYIVGNPPFISKQDRNKEQEKDMNLVFEKIKKHGVLDYVSAWYKKAADYIEDTNIEVAFVSTNSIIQGEQIEPLWSYLFNRNIVINFAHRSFKWKNGLSYNAAVFVVIICFSKKPRSKKYIYDYTEVLSEPLRIKAKNINCYLVDGENLIVKGTLNRLDVESTPYAAMGNMPNDNKSLILTKEEKDCFNQAYPEYGEKVIRRLISAKEMINGKFRWCLWINDENTHLINKIEFIRKRVTNVKKYREASSREATRKLSEIPYAFGEIRQPNRNYICIPRHSSERRKYIPITLFSEVDIVHDSCIAIHSNELYVMGILMSSMHMAWVKRIGGRIKGDYRYSVQLCYNTFPFCKLTNKNKGDIREVVTKILSIRDENKDRTLSELYDPISMPKKLLKAHKELDKLIEKLYSSKVLDNDDKRVGVLLECYKESLINNDSKVQK
ncbi:class I SAM-dependent DNA methyltransferase [Clostridium beijerinckii]|uniref:class I SAM-dependent DNA methyltransferase n=1 Tax=Clostridium beijerinckii TaxID=1520 RepID=UPI0002F1ABA3|nr:DNA methyltransferase [Clostridium beijerinckii]